MAEVKWIKITTDIFDDEKILLIESLPERDSLIVIWFKLLCMAGKQNNSGVFTLNDRIAYTDEMLSTIFRRSLNTVRLALSTFEQYGMIEIINGVITIPNWGKHQSLEQIAERRKYQREYQKEYRKKQKELAAGSDDESKCLRKHLCNDDVNSLEEDIEKDKDKDIDNKNSAKQPSMADVNSFFEALWDMYPVKKGKGQVSESKRRTLYAIGFEKLNKAIERYLAELKKDADWRKPQNGSTFFNSGYVDYLDENFVPDQKGRKEKLPGWFGKRELDEDELNAINQLMSEEDQAEAEQLRKELQESFGKG